MTDVPVSLLEDGTTTAGSGALSGPIILDLPRLGGLLSGIEYYALLLVESLVQRFPQQTFVAVSNSPCPTNLSGYENLRWMALPPWPWLRSGGPVLGSPMVFAAYPLRMLHYAARVNRIIREVKPAVFHGLMGELPLFTVRDVPYVMTVQDLVPLVRPEWCSIGTRTIARLGLRQARACRSVIVPSRATRSDLLRIATVEPERVSLIPLAGNPRYATVEPALSWPSLRDQFGISHPYLVSLATIDPRKNLAGTVRAFNRLADSMPSLSLVIVGRSGWKAKTIMSEVHAARHGSRIISTGYLGEAELREVIAHAAALVYPSFYEGFGLPPLEAMALGVPVVTSTTSSLPEVVGNAALMVDPASDEAIAAAVESILEDDGLRNRLSESGRKRASCFTWDRVADATFDVYRRVSGSG